MPTLSVHSSSSPIVAGWLVAGALLISTVPAAARPADPSGDLWSRLSRYRRSYLRSWKEAFDRRPASAHEVLDAFNELCYAVTGPTGFWRRTVPEKWLGCGAGSGAPAAPCARLAELRPELERWDRLQLRTSRLSERAAARFLRQNHDVLVRYLETVVPDEPSASAMERTPLFAENLRGLVP